jgi:hypothetical protein
LSADLLLERSQAEFTLQTRDSKRDDPAKHIGLVQIGPEKGLLGFKKKRELVAVRSSDYSNHRDPIQIECFDPGIETKAISEFERLGQTLNNNGVYMRRIGYEITR